VNTVTLDLAGAASGTQQVVVVDYHYLPMMCSFQKRFACLVQRVMSHLSDAGIASIDQQSTTAFRSKCESLNRQVCVRLRTGTFWLQHRIDGLLNRDFQHEVTLRETALQEEEMPDCENSKACIKKGQPCAEKVRTPRSHPSRSECTASSLATLSTAPSTSRSDWQRKRGGGG
jgi:hypothetical protein